MESASLAFWGAKASLRLKKQGIRDEVHKPQQPAFMGLKRPSRRRRRTALRANVATADFGMQAVTPFFPDSLALEEVVVGNDYNPVRPEALDEWMNSSVTEIVRSIGDAPLLVHVYTKQEAETPYLEKEKAKAESWPRVVRKWKEGSPVPDGVILVEELNGDQVVDFNIDEQLRGNEGSKLWGVLVQGRGLDNAACYILKTDRVRSSMGFCTYFCLVRANCFGETAELQLRNSWLVNNDLLHQYKQ